MIAVFTCTPSPYGYSPCPGESASDDVERIHCLSLWLLAKAATFGFLIRLLPRTFDKAAAFGQRPKGSVKPAALSLFEGDERRERSDGAEGVASATR